MAITIVVRGRGLERDAHVQIPALRLLSHLTLGRFCFLGLTSVPSPTKESCCEVSVRYIMLKPCLAHREGHITAGKLLFLETQLWCSQNMSSAGDLLFEVVETLLHSLVEHGQCS